VNLAGEIDAVYFKFPENVKQKLKAVFSMRYFMVGW
jgi:hypothetical protein